jgi:hypothetical protein
MRVGASDYYHLTLDKMKGAMHPYFLRGCSSRATKPLDSHTKNSGIMSTVF